MGQTFLFTDLVGWTALAAERGDEDAADVAIGHRGRVRRLLAEHGGEEVKSLGDGLMLRCGDPAAAVCLALEIATLRGVPVRVGVHTGPAAERDGDWYGTTVNVAARLCSVAGGGQALVSEATLRAAGRLDGVAVGERRLHWLKNLREPVAAHVVSPAPRPTALRRLQTAICPHTGPMEEVVA